jgi:tRNA dimethylallyltransferase
LLTEAFSAGGAEVVSADSLQVYRKLNIGTAKPSSALCKILPHHLIDMLEPEEQWTVGDFVKSGYEACQDILKRGKIPIVSGGSAFYLKHFIDGLPAAPPSSTTVREELRAEAAHGMEDLLKELAEVDPVSARRIHPNDRYRVLRALEVFRLTQKPLSSYQHTSKKTPFFFVSIGLDMPREELYRRINQRCSQFFDYGLGEEVRALAQAGYSPRNSALKGIGYREFFIETEPGVFSFTVDQSIEERIALHTRQYAKRQLTFFKQFAGVQWIPPRLSAFREALTLLQKK